MPSNHLRILVIDDDPFLCRLLKIMFRTQNYKLDAVYYP